MTDETPQQHGAADRHTPPAAGDDNRPQETTDRLPGADAVTPRPEQGEQGEQGPVRPRDDAVTPRPTPSVPPPAPDLGSRRTEWVASPPPDPFRPPASALPPPPAPSEARSDGSYPTTSFGTGTSYSASAEGSPFGGFGQPYGQYQPYGSGPGYQPQQPGWNAGAGTARRPRRRGLAAVASVLVAALVGGGVGAAVEHQLEPEHSAVSSALDTPPLPASSKKAPAGSVEQVAAAVRRSVVSIIVSAGNQGDEGTGVIISSDGLILTNNHVVAAAAGGGTVVVAFDDGRHASAEIVGRDPTSDLAVIRAKDVSGLKQASLGRSADLVVGQQVVAFGSPLGLSGTVTSGIVSALNRPVTTGGEGNDPGSTQTVMEAIQTDAAINPGNSGGPLVNLSGQVVGINSAIATVGQSLGGGQSGNIGVGFAIPIDQARPIADELIRQGHADHSQLGVSVNVADDALHPNNGALIESVSPGGSADRGGIKANDVITKVDDRDVDSGEALIAVIRAHRPGDKVTITYTRGGSSHTTQVTLGKQ